MADDPGSVPAPRPERRRRPRKKPGGEAPPVAPIEAAADAPSPLEPDVAPAPSDLVAAPIRIVDPIDSAFPIDFAYPVGAAAEPIDDDAPLAAEPVEPVEPAEPAEPIDDAAPLAAAEPAEPAEPIDDAAPLAAEPAEPAEPVDDAAPLAAAAEPFDETPLPTFVHVAPGTGAALGVVEPAWVSASAVAGEPQASSPADHGWLTVLDHRSPNPEICPFLRAVDEGDRMVAPVEAPDAANRCAALRDAVPQSLRQQELVCLASGHVNCPRYLRGAVVMAEAPAPVRPARALTPAILGSLLVLVLAASASVAFVLAGGGLELAVAPTASPVPSATNVAVVPATPSPTNAPTQTPTPTASPSPSPSPSQTASPSPTPAPTPTPTPEATVQPAPTSDRYALLRPCPDTPRCWIYRVRSGDNLFSIANYFGVSQDSIYSRNPWTRTQGLRAGQELRLPPPTR